MGWEIQGGLERRGAGVIGCTALWSPRLLAGGVDGLEGRGAGMMGYTALVTACLGRWGGAGVEAEVGLGLGVSVQDQGHSLGQD